MSTFPDQPRSVNEKLRLRHAELRKENVRQVLVIVLAVLASGPESAALRATSRERMTGAAFTKFGLAPTTEENVHGSFDYGTRLARPAAGAEWGIELDYRPAV